MATSRPDLLWRMGFFQIESHLREADCNLRDIADEIPDAPGLSVQDVLALVWRETDVPTVNNGRPPEKSPNPWVLSTEYKPLGVVFAKSGPWMIRSEGRIVQIADLLADDHWRIRALLAAYGESKRDTREQEEYERHTYALRMQQRVITARRLLQGVVNALASPQMGWESMEAGAPSLSILEGGRRDLVAGFYGEDGE